MSDEALWVLALKVARLLRPKRGAPLLVSDVVTWAERRSQRPSLLLNCTINSPELLDRAMRWFHSHGWAKLASKNGYVGGWGASVRYAVQNGWAQTGAWGSANQNHGGR